MSMLWQWLATPLSGSATHGVEPWLYWHARWMVLAWGILLPLGALVARYFKVLPTQNWPTNLDNTGWWHAHRSLQWLGMVLASLGLYFVWDREVGTVGLAKWHAWAGWMLLGMGGLQVLGGILRGSKGGPTSLQLRGDHYDMTTYRVWFEHIHKGMGWLSVFLAIVVIGLGMLLADVPRWMPMVMVIWWAGLLALAWRWQTKGRCIDTYQAIWGPDPRHPGNRVPPIGWGIRRPLNTQHHGKP